MKHNYLFLIPVLALLAAPVTLADEWDDDWEDDWGEAAPVEIHGFVEGNAGSRLQEDPASSGDYLLGEARFRLDLAHYSNDAEFSFKGDFLSDAVTSETLLDIRRAWLNLQLASWLDMRLGRQVLTWGTGDLVFLNDLFPKDFQSFFIGRNDEFLKAPSNSLKLSAYSRALNFDLVWTPVFEPDLYITGERLSYFNPQAGGLTGADTTGMSIPTPEKRFKNGEFAARAFRSAGGLELAAYGYWGFSKQPRAFDQETMTPAFSRQGVAGASVRGNALSGIFHAEGAYYHARDDKDGDNPAVPNSHVRGLVGFEREVAPRLTLGLQYYVEHMLQHDAALKAAPDQPVQETRDMATVRLTWLTSQETLILSLFGFVGLGDGDTHWRPSATKQVNDAVSLTLGANIMRGPQDTFFGQLKHNTNGYFRVRYAF